MAADKLNINPSLSQKAVTDYQRAFRSQDGASANGTAESRSVEANEASQTTRETFAPSSEVQALEEIKQLVQIGREAIEQEPDYKEERLEEVKERMVRGDYDTPRIRVNVAENMTRVMKLMEAFVD